MTTNKDSFKQLIAKIKSNTNLRKTPVKRDISRTIISGISDKDYIIVNDSPVKDSDNDDSLSICSDYFHIEDSDSNGSYPLQTYSSGNPMNYLALQLSTSSNEDADQCVSNNENPDLPCMTNILSSNSILKTENVKIDESSLTNASETGKTLLANCSNSMKNVLPMKDCNILENNINIDIKEPALEINECKSKNEKVRLSAKENKTEEITKYSEKDDITYLKIRDEWQEETHDVTSSILEDQDMINDGIDNQLDYGM